jgi:DNA-3-methyladenine glycosylase I
MMPTHFDSQKEQGCQRREGLITSATRCAWVSNDEAYIRYHDTEWGVPLYDDRGLFELLILEGAQAGLSWLTILRKRAHYRAVFDDFDAVRIAAYDSGKIELLLQDAGIIRNRLKIRSAIINAQCTLQVQQQTGSFADFLWQFVGNVPLKNEWRSKTEVPVRTVQSDAMSQELKRRGFKFAGTTICYALMQAAGMVNDHTTDCFRHLELSRN